MSDGSRSTYCTYTKANNIIMAQGIGERIFV